MIKRYAFSMFRMPSIGFEPITNGLCLPATAFAASFEFVVWTFSSLYALPVKSLHIPVLQTGFARDYHIIFIT